MIARTAETVAAEIYASRDPESGLLHDLTSHEAEFLTAFHRIGMECARTKGEAIRAWGDGSRAYDAVAFMANQSRADEYAKALAKFDAAVAVLEDA